jgi:hypothetical protein
MAHDVMREHEKRFAERIRATREAANSLDTVAGRVGAAVRNAWGSMDTTVSEYGMRMVESIREIAQELSQTQTSPAFTDAEKFHGTSVQALNRIIKTVRRYIPKLHRGLKTEMAALNSALARLETSVRALGTALDESPGSKIEAIQREVRSLIEKHSELVRLRKEEDAAVASLEITLRKESELQGAEEKLTSQEAFIELHRCENSLKTKEDEIKQFFHPVTKPLLKLERITLPRGSPPIDSKTVHSIVEAPIETVSSGQSFAITQLFDRLDEALLQGKVEVEERRRRRAEETIREVKNGAIEKMREDYLTAQANVQEMLRQLRAKGLLDQKEQLDRQVADTTHEKERITSRRDDLHRRIEEHGKSILRQKTSLEEQIVKLTKKPVNILAN